MDLNSAKAIALGINKFARDEKVLSRLIKTLPIKYADTASDVLGAVGYGKKVAAAKKKVAAAKTAIKSAKSAMAVAKKRVAKKPAKKRGKGAAAGAEPYRPDYITAGDIQDVVHMALQNEIPKPASRAGRPRTRMSGTGKMKNGKGVFDVILKTLRAPLAAGAVLTSGLDGALGSF